MSDAAILVLRATGWVAALCLASALAASPLARWRALAPLARLRRRLGIAAALFALGHASVALVVYLPHEAWATVARVTWVRSGALALSLLLALLVTSFPPLVVRLRVVVWKPLHRLSYVAGALVVHHLLLAPFAPRAWALGLAAWLVGMLALRAVPRRAIPPTPPAPTADASDANGP